MTIAYFWLIGVMTGCALAGGDMFKCSVVCGALIVLCLVRSLLEATVDP